VPSRLRGSGEYILPLSFVAYALCQSRGTFVSEVAEHLKFIALSQHPYDGQDSWTSVDVGRPETWYVNLYLSNLT